MDPRYATLGDPWGYPRRPDGIPPAWRREGRSIRREAPAHLFVAGLGGTFSGAGPTAPGAETYVARSKIQSRIRDTASVGPVSATPTRMNAGTEIVTS